MERRGAYQIMTYRPLDVDTEWPLVKHEFDSRGSPMPSPMFAMIIGAFDSDNRLQAFWTVQLALHAEPLVVYNPIALRGLHRETEKQVKERFGSNVDLYVLAEGKSVEIAKAMGASKIEYPLEVYVKRLS